MHRRAPGSAPRRSSLIGSRRPRTGRRSRRPAGRGPARAGSGGCGHRAAAPPPADARTRWCGPPGRARRRSRPAPRRHEALEVAFERADLLGRVLPQALQPDRTSSGAATTRSTVRRAPGPLLAGVRPAFELGEGLVEPGEDLGGVLLAQPPFAPPRGERALHVLDLPGRWECHGRTIANTCSVGQCGQVPMVGRTLRFASLRASSNQAARSGSPPGAHRGSG